MDERHDLQYLVRLARIGERHHHILLRNHAQVAVKGLAGVEKKAGRTRRCERRGDLAAHEARFSHARNDGLAAACEHGLHGLGERIAQRVLQVFECQHLGVQRLAGHRQNLGFRSIGHVRATI